MCDVLKIAALFKLLYFFGWSFLLTVGKLKLFSFLRKNRINGTNGTVKLHQYKMESGDVEPATGTSAIDVTVAASASSSTDDHQEKSSRSKARKKEIRNVDQLLKSMNNLNVEEKLKVPTHF